MGGGLKREQPKTKRGGEGGGAPVSLVSAACLPDEHGEECLIFIFILYYIS